jgi:hypothetical protein
MPYRRLPNTDIARLKAMEVAFVKGKELPPFKLAYNQGTLQKLRSILPAYETALSEYKNAYNLQLEKNKRFHKYQKKARLYVSHFIQVVNMAIHRGELSPSTRNYFQLDEDDKKLPSLSSEEEIIEWGTKLIEGEQKRRMKGMSPITNPTTALVKVQMDKFLEAYTNMKNLRKRNNFAQENLNKKREQVDQLIQQLWNEVEDTFNDLPEDLRRNKAIEYGLVYVFRKNELNQIDLLKAAKLNES